MILRVTCLLLLCCPLFAEIERVTIGYNKDICDQKCMRLIKDKFEDLPEANSVSVSQGQIVLGWKPNEKFDFKKVDARMRFVGIGMDNIAVVVRGTVGRSGNNWYINSLGDGTAFRLLNPPKPSSSSYVEYNNIESYALFPAVENQLADAKQNEQIITASGFLLAPWRYPLTIVLGNLSIDNQAEQ